MKEIKRLEEDMLYILKCVKAERNIALFCIVLDDEKNNDDKGDDILYYVTADVPSHTLLGAIELLKIDLINHMELHEKGIDIDENLGRQKK